MPSSKGRDTHGQGGGQTNPPPHPQTPPQNLPSGEFGYFEFVMEVHKSLGILTEAVNGLKETVKEIKTEQKEQTKKIEGINNRIYAALAILALIGFLLQLFGSSINNLISRPPAPPAVQQPTK
jgi:hypothetical protein